MAKIRVTENELKQIISESVKQVMKEDKAARWDRRYNDYMNARNEYEQFAVPFDKLDDNRKAELQRKYEIEGKHYYPTIESWYSAKQVQLKNLVDSLASKNGVGNIMQQNFQKQQQKSQEQAQQQKQQAQQQIDGLIKKNEENLNTILTALKDVTLPNGTARLEEQLRQPGYLENLYQRYNDATQPQQTTQPIQQAGSADTRLQTILAKINYLIGQVKQIPGLNKTIANQKTQIANLGAQLNQAYAQARIAQNPNPMQAANIRQTTQAQVNPEAVAAYNQTQRGQANPIRYTGTAAPVAPQGRPTA